MTRNRISLDDRLQRAVQAAGYTEPTPVQLAAIPPALEGRDIVGTAQTGTGKTAAFVLPMLQSLLTTPGERGRTRALIVSPTRELAEQINEEITQLGRFTNLRSATVYGGVGMGPQVKALRAGAEIIVACPGRLLDHVQRGNADLSHVETLVLDEADRMLDMGFLADVRRIVAQTPRERQTMLFSATFAPEVDRFAREILRDPERIEIGLTAPAQTVKHALCPVAPDRKTEMLLTLLDSTDVGSVLIFTRTKHRANRLAKQIGRSGRGAAVLHSNRSQNQRRKALDAFRTGEVELMVATDIASRGLDVDTISHVINYDIPGSADDYIHRVGRTGRAERNGDAITLVTPEDRAAVRDIEHALGERISVRRIEGFDTGAQATTAPVAAASATASMGTRRGGSSGSRRRGRGGSRKGSARR
ncbi:MAG: DEAD/DEAH box helicase [candidate division WS1 bacterium]|jgi:ATP-dependent RNA helicase RhlE|nr:DEAD/DEAH box helicase [candidate division WS1 bacterium]